MRVLGYRQLADLGCWDDGSTVALTGNIDSFYLKQVAQSIAAKIEGVKRIVHQIEVREYKSDLRGSEV